MEEKGPIKEQDENLRILIVDDHTLVREGFSKMLDLEENLTVVGQASNYEEAISLTEELQPDIVLMDIRLPGIDGIEATRMIKQNYPKVEVIILSMYDEDEYVFESIKAGASGYVLKDISKEELIRAIQIVHSGESLIQPTLARKILTEFAHMARRSSSAARITPLRELSEREIEVLRLVADGNSNKEIAEALTISEKTVKAHLRTIFRKLEVSDRAQAVAYAMRKGWVK